jgi:undecaprenyl diphosphate synthase
MLFSRNKKPEKQKRIERVDSRLSHIAFIMDGNGRWAQRRGLPREMGHKEGAKTFERLVRYCGDIGISHVTVYSFSTENWQRSKSEVDSIMQLLSRYIDEAKAHLEENAIKFVFLGDKAVFSPALREKMIELEKISAHFNLTLNLAVNYGAHDEIVHACNQLISEGYSTVTADDIASKLYTAQSPYPDLIVRTGGDLRLSNFLLWQAAYSELYFTDVLWPDMTAKDVDMAVSDFYRRKRRYGKVDTGV